MRCKHPPGPAGRSCAPTPRCALRPSAASRDPETRYPLSPQRDGRGDAVAGGGSVEAITQTHLVPVLQVILAQFPFLIPGFHSDNGTEYINQSVADLLKRLLIDAQ